MVAGRTAAALDQQPQLVDLGLAFLQGGLLLFRRCHHLAQHLLQRRGVIRQGGEIDRHDPSITDTAAPCPMNLA
jgi:hypothetical protein